jgi:hypothetical protein
MEIKGTDRDVVRFWLTQACCGGQYNGEQLEAIVDLLQGTIKE